MHQTPASAHLEKPYRVSFVTNIIPPYRTTFFEKLNRAEDIEWHFIYGKTMGEQGRQSASELLSVSQIPIVNKELLLGPYTLRWQQGVIAAVSATHPDLVVLLGMSGNISNWLLLLYCKANGIPVLLWACGWEPQRPNSFAWHFKRALAGVYFRLANHILTYSTKGAGYVQALGAHAGRVGVCYNGIEVDHLLRTEENVKASASSLRLENDVAPRRLFLFVGAMLADKRIDLILRAQKVLEDEGQTCTLWLVGDGPARTDLEQLARELSVQYVKFWGRKVHDVDQYFAAADLVVLPGIGGLALNQAMFWGKPCVVSEADGTEEDLVFNNLTGRRFKVGDLESLTSVLRECVQEDPFTLEAWGKAGRKMILERSNVSEMVKMFLSTIREMLPSRKAV